MLVSILINNYNYACFLPEAVDSILKQDYQRWELIIVDDGSSDNSCEIIQQLCTKDPRISAIFQANGGQAAAFNSGVAAAKGEIITFLDADDLYAENYLSRTVAVYSEKPECDFLFTGLKEFGDRDRTLIPWQLTQLTDLGYTSLLIQAKEMSLGEPTSTMSLRRKAALELFPLPFEEDWKICADTALCIASSIKMQRKFCLPEPLMLYRIHGKNAYAGKAENNELEFKRQMIRGRLRAHLAEQYAYGKNQPIERTWIKLFTREATTGDKPAQMIKHYIRTLRRPDLSLQQANISFLMRLKYWHKLNVLFKTKL